MSRAQADALGDTPIEREIKEYWYSVNGDKVKLADAPNNAPDQPADMKRLIETLRNDNSIFCFKVGASTAGDNDTWCATFTIERQSDLPMNRIVEERIIPFLLTEAPQENRFLPAALIPGKYYS